MKRSTYSYGTPFSHKLKESLDRQIVRVDSKMASMIIIDGPLGHGKTTLAVELADYISGGPISLDRDDCPQYAMGGIQFQEKMATCFERKLPVLIYDEAGDFSKHGALTNFNRNLVRTFETFRAFRVVVILVLPTIDSLGYTLFNLGVPRLLVHCHGRTMTKGNFRTYSLMRMFKLKMMFTKLEVKPSAYFMVAPNYFGHFLDLVPDRSKQLDNMTIKGKVEISRNSTIKNLNLVSIQDIAQGIGRSVPHTRLMMWKLKIKPERTFGNKNFYSKNVISVLQKD